MYQDNTIEFQNLQHKTSCRQLLSKTFFTPDGRFTTREKVIEHQSLVKDQMNLFPQHVLSNPRNRFTLSNKLHLFMKTVAQLEDQETFSFHKISNIISGYLQQKTGLIDSRNPDIVLVAKDPIHGCLGVKALHIKQLTNILQHQIKITPIIEQPKTVHTPIIEQPKIVHPTQTPNIRKYLTYVIESENETKIKFYALTREDRHDNGDDDMFEDATNVARIVIDNNTTPNLNQDLLTAAHALLELGKTQN